MRVIFYFLGFVLVALSCFMLLTTFVAFAVQEKKLVAVFLVSSGLIAFIAGSLIFTFRNSEEVLKHYDAFLLALFMWVTVPFFLALPFYISGYSLNFFHAYFESVSGFTTSGTTLFPKVSLIPIPQALLFWRSLIDWIGGLVTLLMVFLILSPVQLGSRPDCFSHAVPSGFQPSISQLATMKWIPFIYSVLTFFCFLLLTMNGLPALTSAELSFSALSTSGFNPTGQEIGDYPFPILLIVVFFMFLGAMSVVWQHALFYKDWSLSLQYDHHYEPYWLFFLSFFFGLFFASVFYFNSDYSLFFSLKSGFSSAVSLLSTSGLEMHSGDFSILPLPLILFLVLIGGAVFSTSGGIKLSRIGAMILYARRELYRLIHPHCKRRAQIGGQIYNLQMLKGIWLIFISFSLAIIFGVLAVTATGMNFDSGFVVIISNLANAGTVYSELAEKTPSWVSYAEMNSVVQSVLILMMILGRMEVLGFLILCNLFFWRS
ncbi:MAG: potassium transporter TrkG [Alphaproteobacteria bacterium]|nr:potassium transporter TrkG [Alphaproteobacteria bacterium]